MKRLLFILLLIAIAGCQRSHASIESQPSDLAT